MPLAPAMTKAALSKAFSKYLSVHAEGLVSAWPVPVLAPLEALCVVPVYDEPYAALASCLRHPIKQKSGLIWVFNAPEHGSEQALNNTQACLRALREEYTFSAVAPLLSHAAIHEHLDLLVLDLSGTEQHLPRKQGVGLARKLGMDLAIRLCAVQLAQTQSLPDWLHSCDADVRWPRGYMEIPAPTPGQVVSLYPFQHEPEPGWELPMALYDVKLDYYVGQLRRAGSPYAFQTVGSAIAVTPQAYVQVHGMPKRSGGEDFYFLNKLAKIGQVRCLEAPVLSIAGRPSERVPFGTGPALRDIQQLAAPLEEFTLYHPESFECLRLLLEAVETYDTSKADDFLSTLESVTPPHSNADKKRAEVVSVLRQLGFDRFWRHVQKQSHQASFRQLFHIWFDGFQTLKFIHALRNLAYPELDLRTITAYQDLLAPALMARIEALFSSQQA